MPNGDKTGPDGQGARTGRGLGNCNGQSGAGIGVGRGTRRGGRRGLGRGSGRGLGINANQGNSWLGDQLSSLQAAIEKLTERLGK